MGLTLTSAPAVEPVTLKQLKEHLRIYDTEDHDVELTALIKEARQFIENQTGRALITQTWTYKLDGFDTNMNIPRPPLQSITSIQYQDASDATQTLASSNYSVDTDSEPGRVVQAPDGTYPSTYDDINVVTVTFVAGYGSTASDVPETLKRAIKLRAEELWDMPTAAYATALENAYMSAILPYKIDWIAL